MLGVPCLTYYSCFANLQNGGRPPLTYQSFVSIAGEPPEPVMEEYSELPRVGDTGEYELLPVPTVDELGYGDLSQVRVESDRSKELVFQLLLDRSFRTDWCLFAGGDPTIPRWGDRSSEENERIASK